MVAKLTLKLTILHIIEPSKGIITKIFLDTIFGIGLIESDIRSVNGEIEFLNKNRLGKQIYLTIKNSDHIERDGLYRCACSPI